MSNKTYNQACSLAVALDIIGDRWTWLIVRALLTGPKRFGELQRQLPGIGSNLLASRLASLAVHDVIEKAGDTRQAAYTLTVRGEGLRPAAHELIRWGTQFRNVNERVKDPQPLSMPEWDMLAIEAAFVAERAAGVQAVIELTLSGHTFHLVIRNRICRAVSGPAVEPDATIVSDSATLMAIGASTTTVQSAEHKVRIKISGDRATANLLFELFEPAGLRAVRQSA